MEGSAEWMLWAREGRCGIGSYAGGALPRPQLQSDSSSPAPRAPRPAPRTLAATFEKKGFKNYTSITMYFLCDVRGGPLIRRA